MVGRFGRTGRRDGNNAEKWRKRSDAEGAWDLAVGPEARVDPAARPDSWKPGLVLHELEPEPSLDTEVTVGHFNIER